MKGFQAAANQYDAAANGLNSGFYPGQTWVPATEATNQGVNSLYQRANAAGSMNGVGAEQAAGQQGARLLNNGAAGTPGFAGLLDTANGGMLGRNPELQGAVDRAIQAARPSIDSAFAAGGRLGSGAHANAFADAATRTAGDIYYRDYGTERGMQQQAQQYLGQQDLAARGLGAQLGQQASQADAANTQRQLQAGAINEDYQQKALEDSINRFNYNQNLPWDLINRYTSLVQGNYGSNSTGTQAQPIYGNSGLSSLFGGAGALGSLASGAASLFALSDARAKENIREVGQLHNGLPVYSYNYKGDDMPQIGLMAQEVAQVRPDAVAHIGGGLLGVNYDAATR